MSIALPDLIMKANELAGPSKKLQMLIDEVENALRQSRIDTYAEVKGEGVSLAWGWSTDEKRWGFYTQYMRWNKHNSRRLDAKIVALLPALFEALHAEACKDEALLPKGLEEAKAALEILGLRP